MAGTAAGRAKQPQEFPTQTEQILGQIALTLAAVQQQAEAQSRQMQSTLARQQELQHKIEESKDFNDATRDLCYDLKKRLDTVEIQEGILLKGLPLV